MPKLNAVLAAGALAPMLVCAPATAAILGPHAAACAAGSAKPAMLVRVEGLKTRTGLIRVQSYGGDPRHFFDKGSYLERVELRTPASGPVEICMPVPAAGTFAVSVRHDIDGDGKAALKDGGGMSGNPEVSLMDVLFKRRPSPVQTSVRVKGVTIVPVVMNYMQGGGVGPVATAER